MNLEPRCDIARRVLLIVLFLVGFSVVRGGNAQTIVNPGFNDTSGWTVTNDATLAHPGGTAPWSWVTPVVSSVVVNATETILPLEGSGLGITYAGADSFTQTVSFPNSGLYTLSVDANAVRGRGAGTLGNGRFELFVDGASSPANGVTPISGWSHHEWTTFVTAGSHDVGIRNTRTAVYSITYDDFAIVPEPSSAALLLVVATGALAHRRR